MWLPLTWRTSSFDGRSLIVSRTRLTHGPAALTSTFAVTSVVTPETSRSVADQNGPEASRSRRADMSVVRTRTLAPRKLASITLNTTRRASSTRASE